MRAFIVSVIVIVSAVFLPATSFAVVIGPYSGRVLDSDTDESLCGASLFIYSIKRVFLIKCVRVAPANEEHSEQSNLIQMYMKYRERLEGEYPDEDLRRYNLYKTTAGVECPPGYRPRSEEYPDLIHSLHIHADENGAYEIQSIYKELEPNSFLESSTVIVYQPGYQVFIKKIRISDADEVFRTKDNIITLKRVPPNFDHNAHYHQIVGAMGEMGETPVFPPTMYDEDSMDDARMDWNLFIEKSLLRTPFESFCRRFEWENRR